MTINIKLEGADEAIKKLKGMGDLKYLRAVIKALGVYLKGKLAQYPPASEANMPGQRRWYERGYGPRWTRRDGSVGGRRTSEILGKRWTTRSINGGLGVEIGNNARYARYVQSRAEQAYFHQARGWRTVEDVAEDEQEYIQEKFTEAIERKINE